MDGGGGNGRRGEEAQRSVGGANRQVKRKGFFELGC